MDQVEVAHATLKGGTASEYPPEALKVRKDKKRLGRRKIEEHSKLDQKTFQNEIQNP